MLACTSHTCTLYTAVSIFFMTCAACSASSSSLAITLHVRDTPAPRSHVHACTQVCTHHMPHTQDHARTTTTQHMHHAKNKQKQKHAGQRTDTDSRTCHYHPPPCPPPAPARRLPHLRSPPPGSTPGPRRRASATQPLPPPLQLHRGDTPAWPGCAGALNRYWERHCVHSAPEGPAWRWPAALPCGVVHIMYIR